MQPQRQREVVKGDDRGDVVLAARDQHAAVVLERGLGELALGRLDPRPLDAEPEGVVAEVGLDGDVLPVAVVEVAGVARRLQARGAVFVLPPPPVAVGVPPFHLVRRNRGAHQEAGGQSMWHGKEA